MRPDSDNKTSPAGAGEVEGAQRTRVRVIGSPRTTFLLRADPILLRADPILLRADPILLRADPILLRADPILLRADPILPGADPILLRADPITLTLGARAPRPLPPQAGEVLNQ